MTAKLLILVAVCFNLTIMGLSSAAVYPTLPQIFIKTTYDPPAGGQIFSVKTSAEFKSALTAANLGDIIELQAGTTFIGTFTLPNKTTGTGWIYIRSSEYNNLPDPCHRVSPADMVNMPTIVAAAGSYGCINTVANSHHFRFVGVEFKPTPNNYLYNVICIGNGETSADKLPNNIVIDRCYIHGDPTAGSRRAVLMNGAYVSVIDSYISDCKEDGADSQALAAYSATGPIKIVNNYLEGAGENVIFGGADPSIPNAVPSDIEIRCNLIFKPLSWMTEQWDIKNLLEFKNAQRVLVEGNRLENCWPNAQSGFALLFTPRNQDNTAPWSVVQDITFRFNTFVNVAQGLNMSGYDAPNTSQRTSRILIQNNVLNVTNLGTGGDGRMFQVLNGPTDIIFDHNTGFCTNMYMVLDGKPKMDLFEFRNNLVSYATYGFGGSGTGNVLTTMAAYSNPNWTITNNAIIGGSATNFPPGSYFPKNNAAVGFVDFAGGDYRLSSSSPYKNLATDGKDIGADIDSIAIMSTYVCEGADYIPSTDKQLDLMIYPNPAKDYITVTLKPSEGLEPSVGSDIQIYNSLGENVTTPSLLGNATPPMEGNFRIDISSLPAGTYFCKVTAGDSIKTAKFVIIK
jgi:hypothetical protein